MRLSSFTSAFRQITLGTSRGGQTSFPAFSAVEELAVKRVVTSLSPTSLGPNIPGCLLRRTITSMGGSYAYQRQYTSTRLFSRSFFSSSSYNNSNGSKWFDSLRARIRNNKVKIAFGGGAIVLIGTKLGIKFIYDRSTHETENDVTIDERKRRGDNVWGNKNVYHNYEKPVKPPSKAKAMLLRSIPPQFVERKGLYEEITNKFSGQNILVLHGLPGVGKSEVAIAFGNQHLEEFHFNVWMIPSTTEDEIASAYHEVSERLGLPLDKKDSFEEMEKRLFRKLENFEEPWLLIYDNLKRPNNFPQRGGKILITTNFPEHFPLHLGGRLPIPCFKEIEAITLMEKITGEKQSDEMVSLVKKLGCYPIWINKVASDIASTHDETMESVNAALPEMELSTIGSNDRYKKTLQDRLKTSLSFLPTETLECLCMCAYLRPEGIQKSFIEVWLQIRYRLKKEDCKMKAQEILSALVNRDWLKYDNSTQAYTFHHAFQKIIRSLIDESSRTFSFHALSRKSSYEQACKLFIQLLEKVEFAKDEKWQEFFSKVTSLSLHCIRLIKNSKFATISKQDQLIFYLKYARSQYLQGDYQKALDDYQRAWEIQRQFLCPNYLDIAKSLNYIGLCLEGLSKYQEALKKFEEALEIQEKSLDPNHPDIASSLNNIGICHRALRNYEEALNIHRQALSIREKSLDPNHVSIASSLGNIGICLRALGKGQEALEKFEEALEIQKKSLASDHPDIAKCLNYIGICLASLDKHQEAIEHHQNALKIKRESLNPNHPDIAKSLKNIGICLENQGKYQGALEKFEEALEIQKKSLASDHPHMKKTLDCIRECLSSQDKAIEAQLKYEQCFKWLW